jgi:hypothetical protein
VLLLGGALFFVPAATAADPTPLPASESGITLTAEPMLGGAFRSGTWAAIRVVIDNQGPAVDGELRLTSSLDNSSTFGRAVQLPTGARQEHVLYDLMGVLNGRFTLSLVSGSATLASVNIAIQPVGAAQINVVVVAEQPQTLVGPLKTAVDALSPGSPNIVTATPEQLPPRAEAWASADVLVWHDAASNRLDPERIDALRTWVATGGQLLIVAGSTGATSLGSFPQDMLPFVPAGTIDVTTTDLQAILGALPAGATSLPALTGDLVRGKALLSEGGTVVAARTPFGLGSVAVLGIDPGTPWLANSPLAQVLWSKYLPPKLAMFNGRTLDEGFISGALADLPAIQLPSLGLLLLIIVGYIVVIGPLNYLVLRRRDRREWAWVTMPASIIAFAVIAYVVGVAQRGSSVVVNELAIVRGATGTDRGVAQVYVGVYAPTRSSFNVKVGGDSLLSATAASASDPFDPRPAVEQPVDVLLGDPSTLRDYNVGFGSLRAFRAQASFETPHVDADLHLGQGRIEGTVVNASDKTLEHVAVVYGTSFQTLGDMAPGQSAEVSFSTNSGVFSQFGETMAQRMFPDVPLGDADSARALAARRAIVQHLAGGWNDFTGAETPSAFTDGPVILGWQSGPTLAIDMGTAAEQVGERVYFLPTRVAANGNVEFVGSTLHSTILESSGGDVSKTDDMYQMGRGTVSAEYRGFGVEGTFQPSLLAIKMTLDPPSSPGNTGDVLAPLSVDEQPDSDNPLAANPRPGVAPDLPRIQFFDLAAGAWVEFEPLAADATLVIEQPERYVDGSGAFRVRFVVRDPSAYTYFTFNARVEGTVQ